MQKNGKNKNAGRPKQQSGYTLRTSTVNGQATSQSQHNEPRITSANKMEVLVTIYSLLIYSYAKQRAKGFW